MGIIYDHQGQPVTPENPLPTTTNGSGALDLRGLAANRPDADAVSVGSTYWAVDTGDVEVTDGTVWQEI